MLHRVKISTPSRSSLVTDVRAGSHPYAVAGKVKLNHGPSERIVFGDISAEFRLVHHRT